MRTLRHAAAVFAGLAVPACVAQWAVCPGGFECRLPSGRVRWLKPGTLEVQGAETAPVPVSLFLWHGKWVYERLEAGRVTTPARIAPDGGLLQEGEWVTAEGVPPMHYTVALEANTDSVTMRLTTWKTDALTLTSGIWCTVPLDRRAFEGQSLYARPGGHGPVGTAVAATAETLLIGPSPGRAVALAGDGFRQMRSRFYGDNHVIQMNLCRGDPAVGERAEAVLTLSFDAMPAEFPGTVRPSRAPLAIRRVTPMRTTVPQYGKLELDVALDATWDNPYDPDDVTLDADVTAASGRKWRQPGFFMVTHRRTVRHRAEVLEPVGNGCWRVRIAALEPGPMRVTLTARDRSGTARANGGSFDVQPSDRHGFIRRSPADPHYLQHDDGTGYTPVGHNLPIYHSSGQLASEAIRKMAAAGENWNRWWMSSSGLGIEWETRLGWYRQGAAARLDAMLDLAAETGFTYMLCMDTHQDFREGGWKGNPYNAVNGGPCKAVRDWFTDERAKALYRKRLRYTVARWGYSPQVLCWEFGNEMEGWADTPQEAKLAWHREMLPVLAALDPYDHLITTSWWSKTGPEECWRMPGMGIVQTHCYTNNDANVAEQVRRYCLHQWKRFDTPHIFGEFGIRSHSTTADKDPKGWAIHNAAWVAIASGCCGNPMPWWHENYIDPLDLYGHFTALSRFVRDLPFGTARWRQTPVRPPEYITPPPTPITRDIVLTPESGWGKAAAARFAVRPDGSIVGDALPKELLHGSGHADIRNPPRFTVSYPTPGLFTVRVGRVSSQGHLKVWVDGTLVLDRELPCGEGIGKSWKHQPRWDLWESVYDEDITVQIPRGTRTIRVANEGRDWIRILGYIFGGCRVVDRPNLLIAALASPQVGIVWIQNRESTWFNHRRADAGEAEHVAPVPPARIALEGYPDGTYDVAWWNTWEGTVERREQVRATDGHLLLRTAPVATDLAAVIRPQ